MAEHRRLSRRTFLRNTGMSGVALTIGLCWPALGRNGSKIISASEVAHAVTELMYWISIDSTGRVTICNHRSEMGQGTWQAIPQIIAEELEVSMDQVSVRSPAADPKKYGPQPQEGSFSIRGWYQQLLRVGASAREMLIQAAAQQWKVEVKACYAENGQVIHRATGRALGYGQLVKAASQLTPPADVTLKARKDYKIIGKPLHRNDTLLKTNGSAIFGMDKKLPGMLYAVVERNPRFRGKVKSFNDTAVRAVHGVTHVLKVKRDVFGLLFEGVAVVANSSWAAMQGRKMLKVEWDDEGFEHLDSEQLYTRMREDLYKLPPSAAFDIALKETSAGFEAIYEAPYQSHSCMEPVNCTADVKENSITIWGPIQEANWIQASLSEHLHIPVENVHVHMTFLGGGFGRKAFTDYPLEAALISKEIKAPVQLLCTREDDMTMGPFRAGAVYRCRGGVTMDKKIGALQIVSASQYIGPGQLQDSTPEALPVNGGNSAGLAEDYYKTIPHYSFGGISTRSPIPTMWWRAPGANVDLFASESFIDELAHLAQEDPLVFRKRHLNSARYQAMIDQLAAFSKWNTRERNAGWGVAITECFGSRVGQVVKVSYAKDKGVKIDKVFAVIDCGWYVNPDIIRAQVEGSIVMGLGAAVHHATHFKVGKAVEKNFNTYPMPRIYEVPAIAVHIMENNENPGGVGEPGLPAFAPALCNAIFDLTGKRIRKLPFALEEV
ncbi:xanthine dehydrogenase family protein molybdopterin-binding subunit [Chitinophaga pinensis]|uniref:Aldehyde oxidase and xanthine dehydrogenase molybdopterin binding n=1 Tax=Chitinophaga pinensis (strain ATCC 43595 / DSM 2588 / LMG 13176 / NBRC 15968 / NCIMB 11800 / UQM 2034) TaxID=485918 RepID=A0A979GA21_CHIPD|nr:molybdopterin cofactor-binding domain-containing protein [Chitinophaga pinensis]ACU63447.1 aldehyde oxidase and xanthine dehydrogenase molybdopterin binding [Chitinophaga pinensis DSM 2588]